MLTQHQVIPYLLQHKLIDPASIVAGDLTIVDVSRRNCNFKVISTQGPCYLIKQGMSPDRVATVAHEAEMYQLLQSDAQAHKVRLSHYLPHFYGYDLQEQILILELLRDAENFRQYHARHGRFSTALASMVGHALGTLHCLPQLRGRFQDDSWFSGRPPWVLTIHRPHLWIFWDTSEAKLQLIRIVQHSTEFCQLLDDLRRDWQADRLIHYDIKWDNWIIFAQSSSRRRVRLKLVDWELAGLGDPCWDVGSVFSGYLSFWLSYIPITGGEPPDRFLELSRYPLERMQPALRSFWASYVQQMSLDSSIADQWLLRAVRYAAARLVQTAFEQMQRSTQLTGNIICILQLSLNMMRRPHEAAVLLLGIPLQQGRVV
jgi:Phosphotransferase enzyme family